MKKELEMGTHDQRWTEVTGQSEVLEQIFRLRVTAWRQQVALSGAMGEWVDPTDDRARHWASFKEGQVIAAVRLSMHASVEDLPHPEVFVDLCPTSKWPSPMAYYGRAVVHPDHRRQGLFSASHEVCIDAARRMGAKCLIAVSGSVAANHFAPEVFINAGYQSLGEGRAYQQIPYLATSLPTVLFHSLGQAKGRSGSAASPAEVAQ